MPDQSANPCGDGGSGCADAVGQLYGYLDGELTDDLRSRIAQHLDDCSPCLQAFDFEDELRHVVAQRCRDRVPEGLVQRVRDALHADPPPAI